MLYDRESKELLQAWTSLGLSPYLVEAPYLLPRLQISPVQLQMSER